MWYTGLARAVNLWGAIGAGALAVIVLAWCVDWTVREVFRWYDFRSPSR